MTDILLETDEESYISYASFVGDVFHPRVHTSTTCKRSSYNADIVCIPIKKTFKNEILAYMKEGFQCMRKQRGISFRKCSINQAPAKTRVPDHRYSDGLKL